MGRYYVKRTYELSASPHGSHKVFCYVKGGSIFSSAAEVEFPVPSTFYFHPSIGGIYKFSIPSQLHGTISMVGYGIRAEITRTMTVITEYTAILHHFSKHVEFSSEAYRPPSLFKHICTKRESAAASRIWPGETMKIDFSYIFSAWANSGVAGKNEVAMVFNRRDVDYVMAPICYASIITPPELDYWFPEYRSWAKTHPGWYDPDFDVVYDREEDIYPPRAETRASAMCVPCVQGRHSECPIELGYYVGGMRIGAGPSYPGGSGAGTGSGTGPPTREAAMLICECAKGGHLGYVVETRTDSYSRPPSRWLSLHRSPVLTRRLDLR